jgi:hypothetical protein
MVATIALCATVSIVLFSYAARPRHVVTFLSINFHNMETLSRARVRRGANQEVK